MLKEYVTIVCEFYKKRSFSLCKHPAEFPYTEIIDSNHDLTFFVKNTHFELRYNLASFHVSFYIYS